ncbi:hypothetical protein GTY81_14265 [Streptomyces sp. SID8366]|uniref:hypothetical protein n=1 Tax=unclassified Streptomyces TaxID=2593676 RepID=UPI000DBAA815|nr:MULTISPECIES: hypothetical protein [unclassified Streptomyces]MYU05027.1 hypothetical protein [Streptomyces sp. SID8366]MYU64168.1 hypothetical protein [Streptomyces sp. SID69]RAJ65898.1 hypothetical protein K376_00165 [Streptomyces sp. PsTaAH-130]
MSQNNNTSVGSSHLTNTGDGNVYMYLGKEQQDGRRTAFRRVADDQLGLLRRVLVAPGNMGAARATLAETGTVILDGVPGSGRTSAAQVLLHEYHRDSGVYNELLPGDDEQPPLRDPELVGTGDRLLLDLSDPARWSGYRADLSTLRKTVHERAAHLVVVMPHDYTLDAGLQPFRVEIARPPGPYVLKRHLRTHGLPYEEYVRQLDAESEKFIDRCPMREIAHFADRIRRARESARPGEGFAHWCATARKARHDRRKEAAELVARSHEASSRALLITVALLHEAHADVVHRAAALLLKSQGPGPDQAPLLQHKDLAERLKAIKAGTDRGGCVRFDELDHDSAVRAHIWDHMPDLRPHLGTWAASVVELADPHLTPAVRDELVARLAGEYLRTGRPEGLASLAMDWSSAAAGQQHLEAAVYALTCGLNHPAYAGGFRERIYQWCRYHRPTDEFAQVLVQVCADVLASTHPDMALIRLFHLARREHGTTRARDALRELVWKSARLHRRLLDRLTRYGITPPDLAVFLHVSDPELLTDPALVTEDGVRRSLTACWHAALTELPRATWQPYAERWFHRTEPGAEVLLDLLVGAAGQSEERRGELFAALYTAARAAERTAPGGPVRAAETTELLLHKIGAAQGLGPAGPPPSSTRGTRP